MNLREALRDIDACSQLFALSLPGSANAITCCSVDRKVLYQALLCKFYFGNNVSSFMQVEHNVVLKLRLVDCKGLNGTSIMYVEQVPKLRKLVIEHCDLRVLKPGLQCILDMCHLEILSFAFTKYACSLQFERIPEKLVKLRVLNVAYCELDERLFQHLKEQIPGLQVYAPDDASRYSQIQKDTMKRLMKL